jgi:hypothetical protein
MTSIPALLMAQARIPADEEPLRPGPLAACTSRRRLRRRGPPSRAVVDALFNAGRICLAIRNGLMVQSLAGLRSDGLRPHPTGRDEPAR